MNEIKKAIETIKTYGIEKFVDDEGTTIILIGIDGFKFEEKCKELQDKYIDNDYDYDNFYPELSVLLAEESQYFIILN